MLNDKDYKFEDLEAFPKNTKYHNMYYTCSGCYQKNIWQILSCIVY